MVQPWYIFGRVVKRVHSLIGSQAYRLRVEVQQASTSRWYSAEYSSFRIDNEATYEYRLDVSGYSGDAGDALCHDSDHNGNGYYGWYLHNWMKFTTYDNDNDNDDGPGACSSNTRGGWWYNRCHYACLTCRSVDNVWWTLPGDVGVVNSRMLIKPQ